MNARTVLIVLIVGLSAFVAVPGAAQPLAGLNSPQAPAANLQAPASDPVMLWNTFLGGSDWDDGWAAAVDSSGAIYVAGTSQGSWGSPVSPYQGAGDAFVAKLSSSGVLQWNAFLGSPSGEDQAYAIAVDGNGNVNVAGESLFPWGAPLHAHSGEGSDAFVAQLGSNGQLKWNTFHGGWGIDRGWGLAVDQAGGLYLAGESYDTWGSPVVPPSSSRTNQEAFVAKLSNSGALLWNTFMGDANAEDYARSVAVGGAVVVSGHSKNTWGSPVRAHSGDWYGDAFVAQLNSGTGVRQWHTFLGGVGTDEAMGVAAGGADTYVTGYSDAGWGAPVQPFPGKSENVFVARLNGSGALQWHTFLGGGDYEDDRGHAISVGRAGRIYVAGQSDETWGAPSLPHGDDWDAFAACLGSGGALLWNAFLGGDDTDYGFALASDATSIYVAGESHVAYGDWGNPVRPGAGKYDAFVVRLDVPQPTFYYARLPLVLRNH